MMFILTLLLAMSSTGFSQTVVLDKIVAVVNDQIVTKSDMEQFKNKLKRGSLVDEGLLRLNDPQKILKDDKALLNHLIDERLLDSEVKRKGLEVTIERVEQEIRSIAKKNGLTRNQLREAVVSRGNSFAQYQDFIKTSLERQALIEKEVQSKIRISDEDVVSYLSSQKSFSGQIFEYQLSQILILNRKSKDAAQKRAMAALTRIQGGESFEKVADEVNEDPGHSKGGAIGTFKADELQKELETAVRPLGPGEISGLVVTANGFHILKVNKKRMVADSRFEETKSRIIGQLQAEAFQKQFRSWLDQRRDDSFISIKKI